MTVTNTSLLGLALPTTGTESGVWGDDVNNGLTILIDVSVAGTNNITQNSDITLAVSNGNNSSSFTSTATNSAVAQYYVLNCSGARTALRNIIVPTTSKTYVVTNGTTGGFGITVKKSGGTGVTVAAGETAIVFYNTVTGDVAKVTSTVNVSSFSAGTTGLTPNTATTGAVTLAGTLATTNGGTGLTSFTSGGVVYASSTSALATGSALTFNGTNLLSLGNPSNIAANAWSGANAFQAGNSGNFYGDGQSSNWVAGVSLNSYRSGNAWYNTNASLPTGRFEIGNGATGAVSGFAFLWGAGGSAGAAAAQNTLMAINSSGQMLLNTASTYSLINARNISTSTAQVFLTGYNTSSYTGYSSNYYIQAEQYPSGANGTTLTIPITNQGNVWVNWEVRVRGVASNFNNTSNLAFSAIISASTSTFALGFTETHTGNVASIAMSGTSIVITFTTSYYQLNSGYQTGGVCVEIEFITRDPGTAPIIWSSIAMN